MTTFVVPKTIVCSLAAMLVLSVMLVVPSLRANANPFDPIDPKVPDYEYDLDVTLQVDEDIGTGFGLTLLGRTSHLKVKVKAPKDYDITSISRRAGGGDAFWVPSDDNPELPAAEQRYEAYNIPRDVDHSVGFSGTVTRTTDVDGGPGTPPGFDIAVADLWISHHEKLQSDGSGLILEPTVQGPFDETIGEDEGVATGLTVKTQWQDKSRSQVGQVILTAPKGVALYDSDGNRLAYTDGDSLPHTDQPISVPSDDLSTIIRIVANDDFEGTGVVDARFYWDSDIVAESASTYSTAEDYVRVFSVPQLKIVNTPRGVFADASGDVPLAFEIAGAGNVFIREVRVTLSANGTNVYDGPAGVETFAWERVVSGDAAETAAGTNMSNGLATMYTVIIPQETFANFMSPGPRRVCDQLAFYRVEVDFAFTEHGDTLTRSATRGINFVADKTVRAVELGGHGNEVLKHMMRANDPNYYQGGSDFDGYPFMRHIEQNVYWYSEYDEHDGWTSYSRPEPIPAESLAWDPWEEQWVDFRYSGAWDHERRLVSNVDQQGFTAVARLYHGVGKPPNPGNTWYTGVTGIERGVHFVVTYGTKDFASDGTQYENVVDMTVKLGSLDGEAFSQATVAMSVIASEEDPWTWEDVADDAIMVASGALGVMSPTGFGQVVGAAQISMGTWNLIGKMASAITVADAHATVYGVLEVQDRYGDFAAKSWLSPGKPGGADNSVVKPSQNRPSQDTPALSAEVKMGGPIPASIFTGWQIGLRADVGALAKAVEWLTRQARAEIQLTYPDGGFGREDSVEIRAWR